MNIGDNVKLIKNTKYWEGYGFENSTIIKISRTLIYIKSEQGHTMYVRPDEIKQINNNLKLK